MGKLVLTAAMKDRVKFLGIEWADEGEGYASCVGSYMSTLAYVALPKGHPAIGDHYDSHDPVVNGGLTFGEGNVFGWDYGHAYNYGSPETDILAALSYFREIAAKVPA